MAQNPLLLCFSFLADQPNQSKPKQSKAKQTSWPGWRICSPFRLAVSMKRKSDSIQLNRACRRHRRRLLIDALYLAALSLASWTPTMAGKSMLFAHRPRRAIVRRPASQPATCLFVCLFWTPTHSPYGARALTWPLVGSTSRPAESPTKPNRSRKAGGQLIWADSLLCCRRWPALAEHTGHADSTQDDGPFIALANQLNKWPSANVVGACACAQLCRSSVSARRKPTKQSQTRTIKVPAPGRALIGRPPKVHCLFWPTCPGDLPSPESRTSGRRCANRSIDRSARSSDKLTTTTTTRRELRAHYNWIDFALGQADLFGWRTSSL